MEASRKFRCAIIKLDQCATRIRRALHDPLNPSYVLPHKAFLPAGQVTGCDQLRRLEIRYQPWKRFSNIGDWISATAINPSRSYAGKAGVDMRKYA